MTLKSFAPALGKNVKRISWTCTHIVYVHVANTDLGGDKIMEHNLVLVDLKQYHTKCGEVLCLFQDAPKVALKSFGPSKTVKRTAWTFNHIACVIESDTE